MKHAGDAGSKEYFFYGVDGQLMASYRRTTTSGSSYVWEENWKNFSFAGRLIQAQSKWVLTDRLGSVRWREDSGVVTYFPYVEGGPGNANAFATYFRDSQTGLNYADQRYHTATYGRFLTPDPYQASAGPADPGSWNRYAYVEGDPVNKNDPSGLFWETASLMHYGADMLGENGGGWGAPCTYDPLGWTFSARNVFCLQIPLPMAVFWLAAGQDQNDEDDEPECFAQLKYRPVEDWRARLVGIVRLSVEK